LSSDPGRKPSHSGEEGEEMKTGIIVYVVGKERADNDFDVTEAVKDLRIEADRVEAVLSGEDHFDVMDAWWVLTRKGMKKIVCMMGEVVSPSKVRLTGRTLLLYAS
jgi:hypothetical protein